MTSGQILRKDAVAMSRWGKIRVFIYVIVFLLLVEFTLQAAGYFMLFAIKKQDLSYGGDFNIVCIGDSFTYGLGAPRDESYPMQLERILNKSYPQSHIKVINFGIPGYNSSQCFLRLRDSIDRFKPRVIIAMMGMNNCWNFQDSSYFKIYQSKYDYPITFRLLSIDCILSKSKIYKFLKILFLNLQLDIFVKKQLTDVGVSNMNFIAPMRQREMADLLRQGVVNYEAGNYSAAESCYRKAMELSFNDYEPHWYMGRLYTFKGEIDRGHEEYLLALKYAPGPINVICILNDMEDKTKPVISKSFEQFSKIVRSFRNEWIEKFGKENVARLIDPMVSREDYLLEKVIFYDCTEIRKLADRKKAAFFLMTYPNFSSDKFRLSPDIYLRISVYLNIPLIDNNKVFDQHLKLYKKEDLFVADGHCTDKGYGFVAENVFNVLKKCNLLPAEYAKN